MQFSSNRSFPVICIGVVVALLGLASLSQAAYQRHTVCKIIQSKAPLEDVQAQLDALTPIMLNPDYAYLPDSEQEVIALLVEATRYMAKAFSRQVHWKNWLLEKALESYVGTPEQAYYDYFKLMVGPWDRLNENEPFINLDEPKPAGANYYPKDLTVQEFEDWIAAHPEDEAAFRSELTMIRRFHDRLYALPYSLCFYDYLKPAAGLLRKAARKTSDPTLAKYLRSRARAFLTNDYRQSDTDWIGLEGDIELVMGPYETYEDELLGYKAAFESFLCLVDREESQKLEIIEQYRSELVDNLPLPSGYVIEPKGLSSPIKVVNEVFSGGDSRSGIAAIAFNLPNDAWVRENVGSKNVMLKNMLEAKYNGVLVPITAKVLAPEERDKPSFDGFFNYVLMHEISHGLNPGNIVVNGRETTVRAELKELYSTIEECLADTESIWNNLYMIGVPDSPMPPGLAESLYQSYLAGMFRSIRFGIDSAHGGGIAIQLNWHLENGGFLVNPDGEFYIDETALMESVRILVSRLLEIELTGDYRGAQELITQYRHVPAVVQAALDNLDEVPIDVIKQYPFDNCPSRNGASRPITRVGNAALGLEFKSSKY